MKEEDSKRIVSEITRPTKTDAVVTTTTKFHRQKSSN